MKMEKYKIILKELTNATLPGKPVDPVVRWAVAVKKPFDRKFLCRRHNSADALDSQ